MIKIKPVINYTTACPYCNGKTTTSRVIWQGIHIGVVSSCVTCQVEIVADLPVGQAQFTPYQLNVAKNEIFGDACALKWFGRPFLESLRNPYEHYPITIQVEKRRNIRDVVILNCIDYLYGHSLLKLLNADAYQKMDQNVGLVVIVPSFLRWMVPNYVAEIWVVNIPLSKAKNYFPKLNEEIQHQLTRFNQVYVSLAHSHPINFDIVNFTGVKPFAPPPDELLLAVPATLQAALPVAVLAVLLEALPAVLTAVFATLPPLTALAPRQALRTLVRHGFFLASR